MFIVCAILVVFVATIYPSRQAANSIRRKH
jgi:ABC-type lipoprotein release transport system permease subunit